MFFFMVVGPCIERRILFEEEAVELFEEVGALLIILIHGLFCGGIHRDVVEAGRGPEGFFVVVVFEVICAEAVGVDLALGDEDAFFSFFFELCTVLNVYLDGVAAEDALYLLIVVEDLLLDDVVEDPKGE